ncbi:MAG: hypothetical protein MUE87_04520 [Methanothrix sp.]|jgi:hypothetical protein|nr:hypothetical protein [Methanothrix sp.]
MLRPIRGIMLLLLAAVLAGSAEGDLTVIPASEDVYISMGESRGSVFNETDLLLCAVNVTEDNQTRVLSYPGCPVLQFNITNLSLSEDDMAVLLLKAGFMNLGPDPVSVALVTIGSDWDESSDYTTFLVNILPAWKSLNKNDATTMSSNTDGDSVFAFDVSKKLLVALADENRISFLLEANSNSSAEIAFGSRESDFGPCLVIMPYPETRQNATLDLHEDSNVSSSMNLTG